MLCQIKLQLKSLLKPQAKKILTHLFSTIAYGSACFSAPLAILSFNENLEY